MSAPSFDDLYLLPAERRLLKQLQRHGRVVVSAANQDAYRKLNGYGLVFKPYDSVSDGIGSSSRQYHAECLLTDKGERYFACLSNRRIEFWKSFFSQFISGLVVGILSTIVASWLMGWLHLGADQVTHPSSLPTITVSVQPMPTPIPIPTPLSNTLFHSDIDFTPS